ncbi:MAG: TolC family protein [Treponema sp.]|nr:TolC family protein [Treponema sp.]
MIEFKKAATLCLAVFASALCAAQEEAPAAKEQAPEQVLEQAQGQAPEEAPEQKEKFLTLNDAIVLAVENNFDLQRQRYAVAAARGQYHQAAGLLDVQLGTQAEYSMSQNPVDQRDPRYVYSYSFLAPKTNYGVYSDNTLRHQTSGSIFVKKLFSFGLEAKLSYTLKRERDLPKYSYGKNFDTKNYSKYQDEDGRNVGQIGLELSLPLFKSFKNSMAALKLKSAKENLDAMESSLLDAVSQTIINVSNDFWNYYMARRNVELLEDLQKKSEQRTANMQVLIQSGARSRNDLLAMQVNELENRRRLQDARMAFDQKKIKLMESIGVSDFDLVGEPQNPFETIDLTKVQPPEMQDINKELLAFIEENRPDLRALKLKSESCLLKMKMAKADSLPDAKLNFGLGTTGAAYSNNFGEFLFSPFWNVKGLDLNGAASVSIMLGNRTKKGSYEQAEAEYNSSVSEYNKAKNALALQTQNAAQKLLTYKDEVADADRILELQKNLYDNEQQRFRAGLITVNNLIDQDQKYIMAVSAYCQVFINYMNAILEYKRASGGLVSLDTTSAFLKK